MMKIIGYNLNRDDGLNFGKGRRIPLQPFVPEGKLATITIALKVHLEGGE